MIITPVSCSSKDKIAYGLEEAMHAAKTGITKQVLEKDSYNESKFKEQMPAMQREIAHAFEKNKSAMKKVAENIMANQEFQKAHEMLIQKFDPSAQSEDYLRELNKLKIQFFPELSELNKEFAEIAAKYTKQ